MGRTTGTGGPAAIQTEEWTLNQRRPDTPPPPPVVQRVRIRYAKRSRLRFTSHRDFARAFERALRRAGVPVAHSAGFTPHPRVSYLGAAPTGVASEAEYLELGLAERVDCDLLRAALDRSLPDGLDVTECVEAGPGSLADRIDASLWWIELAAGCVSDLRRAVERFRASQVVEVERLTKNGRRKIDARAAVVSIRVRDGSEDQAWSAPPVAVDSACAILEVVVRQVTPAVRPDDVLVALRVVAGFVPPVPPCATRVASCSPNGSASEICHPPAGSAPRSATDSGRHADPLAPDRVALRPVPIVGTSPVG